MGLNSEILVMERASFLKDIPDEEIVRIIQNSIGGKVYNIYTTSKLITLEVSPTIGNEFKFQQKKRKNSFTKFLEELVINDFTESS